MFEDFKTDQVDVGEASIYLRYGGDGPQFCCCTDTLARSRP